MSCVVLLINYIDRCSDQVVGVAPHGVYRRVLTHETDQRRAAAPP